MKLNSIFSSSEFEKINKYLSKWEYTREYSEDEIDIFDEELENLNQELGYETSLGIFISDMIYKLRSNPQY
ncbi:hypothetical protein [Streptococcus himalayensis]|uniref:Uncharacterized protein n=1 Tax=Streptococcus himalayensis TaxID=1888195 RepID=A0A917A4A3_9STRE|nr:hypothetical protein [Streptococcus himalayensis]QBX25375.1 hypothetical protein Javan254_0020 [Streptococcus phage Javan254]GGE26339.1 hypothetical protein GCM10011510_04390 [Streptococcus himalayensis]